MNRAASFEIEGFWLEERQRDLMGNIVEYAITGTRYYMIRTPKGWRCQLQPHGRARRSYRGPAWPDLRMAVAYLRRYGYISWSEIDYRR